MSDSRESMRAAVEALEGQSKALFNAGLNFDATEAFIKGRQALSLLRAALEAREEPAGMKEVELNIIRFWPDGMADRLEHVWKDVIGFIPNYKLYDLQLVLAEFGFTMKVYERAASPAAATQGDAKLLAYLESQKFHPSASHVPPDYRDGYNRALQTVIERVYSNQRAAIGAESEQATEDGRHG